MKKNTLSEHIQDWYRKVKLHTINGHSKRISNKQITKTNTVKPVHAVTSI